MRLPEWMSVIFRVITVICSLKYNYQNITCHFHLILHINKLMKVPLAFAVSLVIGAQRYLHFVVVNVRYFEVWCMLKQLQLKKLLQQFYLNESYASGIFLLFIREETSKKEWQQQFLFCVNFDFSTGRWLEC